VKKKLVLMNLRSVFIKNTAPGQVVLCRSHSDELGIQFGDPIDSTQECHVKRCRRLVRVGVKQESGALHLSISGEDSRIRRESGGLTCAVMRILVPKNVRLDLVSDNGRLLCREFPAVLVLRDNGASRSRLNESQAELRKTTRNRTS